MTGQLVKQCIERGKGLLELSPDEWKELLPAASEDLQAILSLEKAVERRKTYGGTSPERVREQIGTGEQLLSDLAVRKNGYRKTITDG